MPLNVDRTSIGLAQASMHEHPLERPGRTNVATVQDGTTETGDVALDVRVTRGTYEDVTNLARAEELVKAIRGDSIAALRGLHAGIDPNRAAALLAD
jgi:hypothetical protein